MITRVEESDIMSEFLFDKNDDKSLLSAGLTYWISKAFCYFTKRILW